MGIVTRHDVAGIPSGRDNSRFNAGMQMVQRQQERDAAMRLSQTKPLKYNTGGTYGGIGIGDQRKKAKPGSGAEPVIGVEPVFGVDPVLPPTRAEQDYYIDAAIRAGEYDPDTIRALRDNRQATRRAMRDRNLDSTQRSDALMSLDSQREQLLNLNRSRPMAMPAMEPKAPTARDIFRAKPEQMDRYVDIVRQRYEAQGRDLPSYPEMVEEAIQIADQTMGLLQGAPLQQGQMPPAAAAPAPVPAAPPPVNPDMKNAAETGAISQMPTSQPGSFAMDGSGSVSTVFGAPNVLATPATTQTEQGASFDTSTRINPRSGLRTYTDASGRKFEAEMIGVDPETKTMAFRLKNGDVMEEVPMSYIVGAEQWMQSQLQDQENFNRRTSVDSSIPSASGVRTWTDQQGRTFQGEMRGFRHFADRDPSVSDMVEIQSTDGKLYTVPLERFSSEDQQFIAGTPDYRYQIGNSNLSTTYQSFDPSNPDVQRATAPVPRQTPAPEQLQAGRRGKYGLGGLADQGIRANRAGERMENPPVYQQPTVPAWGAATSPGLAPREQGQWRGPGEGPLSQREFNKKVREQQAAQSGLMPGVNVSPGDGTVVGGQAADTPALTQRLAAMSPSERRAYSKRLYEEGGYGQRNETAAQELAILEYAKNQPPQIRGAITTVINPKASKKARDEAAEFLISKGIDLSTIKPVAPARPPANRSEPPVAKEKPAAPARPTPEKPSPSSPSRSLAPGEMRRDPNRRDPYGNYRLAAGAGSPQTTPAAPTVQTTPAAPAAPVFSSPQGKEVEQAVNASSSPSRSDMLAGGIRINEEPEWTEWWKTQNKGFEIDPRNAEVRKFVSVDGRKSFNGKVLRVSDNSEGPIYVTVQNEDGTVYNTTFDKFSRADKEYINELFLGGGYTDEEIKKRAKAALEQDRKNRTERINEVVNRGVTVENVGQDIPFKKKNEKYNRKQKPSDSSRIKTDPRKIPSPNLPRKPTSSKTTRMS